jgi:hypothetical protein
MVDTFLDARFSGDGGTSAAWRVRASVRWRRRGPPGVDVPD